ncbi:MAG: AAA family ATPase [Eubacteriales bacterium]
MICVRCKKRTAVIFIQRIEGDRRINESICLKCAQEMGIQPVNDIIAKLGVGDDELDALTEEMENLIDENAALTSPGDNQDERSDEDIGRAPTINIRNLMEQFNPFGGDGKQDKSRVDKDKQTDKQKRAQKRKNLDAFCLDLTERARDGKLDSIVGRERELNRVIQILCRRQKNNPCLIGEPGVGKTAIAEALAQRIASGRAPYKLRDKEVHLLDLTSLVAGTSFRGQFEARMKGLIEEVKSLGNIILVIDEVHSIVGAGDAEGSMNAANILKPALSRGEIQVIGATTLGEYRKYIEKDSALERRFQPIVVKEPSIDQTVEILRGVKGYYEAFHGIKIPDDTVAQAVTLSERYITDRFLPDKAIDLLDESASYLALNSPVIEQLEDVNVRLAEVTKEIEALEGSTSGGEETYQRIADLKVKKYKLLDTFHSLSRKRDDIVLTKEHLAQVIEVWTGIPASSVSESEFVRIDTLEGRLKGRIVGQDEAVGAVVRAVKRSRAGIAYKRKPVSFIFAGPTGVGKTELVKTLASDLFNSPEALIRLDMSEFMEKHSVSRIIGAPPGYVGYDEAGQLTEKIRRKPYSVVLFDEIEKAHPDVMNILLQILDDGRITDAHGREVNFENTIVVMTTNAGSSLSSSTAGFTVSEKTIEESKTLKALNEFLRPEFLNRVDEIITFRALDENDFTAIADIQLSDLSKTLAAKDILFSYTPEAAKKLASMAFSRKYGARNLRRTLQTKVEDVMAGLIVSNTAAVSQAFMLDTDENGEIRVGLVQAALREVRSKK